jgi:hypothetical protein
VGAARALHGAIAGAAGPRPFTEGEETMARRPNYGAEKRSKEINKQKKREEKEEKKRQRKEEAALSGLPEGADDDETADGDDEDDDGDAAGD